MTKHSIGTLDYARRTQQSTAVQEKNSTVCKGGVIDGYRSKAEDLNRSGRARRNDQSDAQTFRNASELSGVGIISERCRIQCKSKSFTMHRRTARLDVLSAYMPQTWSYRPRANRQAFPGEVRDMRYRLYSFFPS